MPYESTSTPPPSARMLLMNQRVPFQISECTRMMMMTRRADRNGRRSGRQSEDGPLGASLEAAGRLQNLPRLEHSRPRVYFIGTLLVMIQLISVNISLTDHRNTSPVRTLSRASDHRRLVMSWASQTKTRVSSTTKAQPHLPCPTHKPSRIFSLRNSDVFYEALGISHMRSHAAFDALRECSCASAHAAGESPRVSANDITVGGDGALFAGVLDGCISVAWQDALASLPRLCVVG